MSTQGDSRTVSAPNEVSQGWAGAVLQYTGFAYNRRPDSRFGMLPGGAITFLTIAAYLFVIALVALLFDADFLEWARAGHTKNSNWFKATTDVGKSEWMLVLSGVGIILYSFMRTDNYQRKSRISWHNRFLYFYFFFSTIAFSGLIALGFKNLIGRTRPFYVEDGVLFHLVPFGDRYMNASMPSGHATTAGAACATLILLFPRAGWVLVPVWIWVAASRTMIGVHFPSDVLAGFLFGVLFALLNARIFARKRFLFKFSPNGWPRVAANF